MAAHVGAIKKSPAGKRQACKDLGAHPGKVLAQRIIPGLEGKAELKLEHDNSTNNSIRHHRKLGENARSLKSEGSERLIILRRDK